MVTSRIGYQSICTHFAYVNSDICYRRNAKFHFGKVTSIIGSNWSKYNVSLINCTIYKWGTISWSSCTLSVGTLCVCCVCKSSELEGRQKFPNFKKFHFSDNDVMSRDGIMTSCHVTIFQHRPARYLKVDANTGWTPFPFILFFSKFPCVWQKFLNFFQNFRNFFFSFWL